MTLEEMKKMAYWHTTEEGEQAFCPSCHSPLRGEMAFFWHRSCFLQVSSVSPTPSPSDYYARRRAARVLPRRPAPSESFAPSADQEVFSRPILRCRAS